MSGYETSGCLMKFFFNSIAICLWAFLSISQDGFSAEVDEVISKVIDNTELNVPFMDLSAAPSSIVGGAVNVITGSYFDSECDLVIPGANPFVLQRSYNSSSHKKGTLCHGWDLNYPSKAEICSGSLFNVTVNDRGSSLTFKYCPGDERDMKISSKQLH